jgi:hypothetical protein
MEHSATPHGPYRLKPATADGLSLLRQPNLVHLVQGPVQRAAGAR